MSSSCCSPTGGGLYSPSRSSSALARAARCFGPCAPRAPVGLVFRGLGAGLAARGKLQLGSLEVGDRVVAMKCNLVSGQAVFCFKSAFDEGVAAMSPGVQLEVADMAEFEVGDAEWMDSCTAVDNAM